jgi:hypothetical protein
MGAMFPIGLRKHAFARETSGNFASCESREMVVAAYLFDGLGQVIGYLLYYPIVLQYGIAAPSTAGGLAYCLAFGIHTFVL